VKNLSELFESTLINGMKLENRFIRSATHTNMADENGSMTPELTALLPIWLMLSPSWPPMFSVEP
jgi:2,4-dienoyl-CoA reductase-like NADH-dependent reductase (Old Yellow Enzyme family)